jgi:sporulation protein YlmC with PRC-barrel domain
MFRSLREMTGYTVHTQDSEAAGTVSDFLFDDVRWIVRYMVVDSSQVFNRKRVLLSPIVFALPEREREIFPVKVTASRIASSPDFGDIDPITRRHEAELHEFYQWPSYWEAGHEVPSVQEGMSGWSVTEMMTDVEAQRSEQAGNQAPILRSFDEITGYTIISRDGEQTGELYDLLVQDESWRISYMIVSIGGMLSAHRVVLSPSSILRLDWENSRLELDLTHETILKGQEYNPDIPLDQSEDEEMIENDPSRKDL